MYRFFIFLFALSLSLIAATDKNQKLKEQELKILREQLESARDSLQNEIAARWKIRQIDMNQREKDKEELVLQYEKTERLRNELAQIKEECYSQQRAIETEQGKLSEKKEAWNYLVTSMEDALKRESDQLIHSFPVDIEQRRMELEELRRKFKADRNVSNALNQLISYYTKYLEKGSKASIGKTTILPETGDPQEITIARLGNVSGYGVNRESDFFIINQSGNLGSGRYSTEHLGSPALREFLSDAFPRWIEMQKIEGPLMLDIMQNAQSSILIKGQKIKRSDQFKQFIKAGGPVMYPLGFLVVWALALMFWKLIVFSRKYTSDSRISKNVMNYLNNNDIEKAKSYISKHHGVVARVVHTCLEHSKWPRASAEKAVKEILIEELPQLNSHLNTLAVIAGAAPLLGLLGTVTGMINLFEVITSYGTGDPKILAAGISEALITTEVGLIIAIPVMLIHNFLRNRADNIQAATEKHAMHILNRLWPED
jgi:biopolymer transport protein ExbB